MKLFDRKSEYSVAWEPKPWWRIMSLNGWLILFFGLFATFSFVFGLVSGEVLFIASPKQKSGVIDVSFESSPVWFYLLMLANLAIAFVTWNLFFSWLRERRR